MSVFIIALAATIHGHHALRSSRAQFRGCPPEHLRSIISTLSTLYIATADDIVQLDANNMMAGQILMFELELVSIEPAGKQNQ